MKRVHLKKILKIYYSEDSIKSLLCGRRKPSYQNMIILNEKHNIPIYAWKDIKTFLKCSISNEQNKNEYLK